MATFLELAQTVGSESGTVDGDKLTTVATTNNRLRKIVRWTNDAYRQIQNTHRAWHWLQGEFEGDAIPGLQRLSAAAIAGARFAEWGDRRAFTIYDPEIGLQSEGSLFFTEWAEFYRNVLRGVQLAGRPQRFSISPAGELVLTPTPDRAYKLRGLYRMAPQKLALDDDVPDMPEHFHHIIVDAAVIMLGTHDEAAPTLPLHKLRNMRDFSQLEREQLPQILLAGALGE